MFFLRYFFSNLSQYFGLWFFFTILNQVIFFGACLQPYCILASVPHVSLFSLGMFYLSYKSSLSIYDEQTGLNLYGFAEDGYNKDGYDIDGYKRNGYNKEHYHKNGYDINGYDKKGYDKEGYDKNGLTKDNIDRNGKGRIARFFAGDKYKTELKELNTLARLKNKLSQDLETQDYFNSFEKILK